MHDVKMSIIIPVFNAEKNIADCLDSLLSQTLKECEFILVNDGSTDQSKEIIEQYLKEDSRIVLLNQENQGVSKARNNGLRVARGSYIGFVDADDYIDKDYYEVLYYSALKDDCDIVISNLESEIEGHKVLISYPFPTNIKLDENYINNEILTYFLKNNDLNSVCNKIFKNRMLSINNIEFPAGVRLGEDGIFNIYSFSYASVIKYIDYTGYYYREVLGSATRNHNENDYFARAIEEFHASVPDIILRHLNKDKVQKLKAAKLIKNVMSYIHIYSTPTNRNGFRYRYKKVKFMISHYSVRTALQMYPNSESLKNNRYEKAILLLIRKQSALGLFFITSYSRFRNKSFGGIL